MGRTLMVTVIATDRAGNLPALAVSGWYVLYSRDRRHAPRATGWLVLILGVYVGFGAGWLWLWGYIDA